MKPRIAGIRRSSLVSTIFTILAIPVLLSDGIAASYYISPTGSDSNSGAATSPWKTFAFAIPRLSPGDTLILKDGVYSASNSGYPHISKNGTASQPITIKAENERQAFIDGDGNVPFWVSGSSYLVFEGIRIRNRDVLISNPIGGHVIYVGSSNHLTFRRCLVHNNNRYYNGAIFALDGVSYSLFEENELYFFHRNGLSTSTGTSNVFRRNYANSRNYADISGGYPSGPTNKGDSGFQIYPGTNHIFENNIAENTGGGFDMHPEYGPTVNNRFYGNIALSCDMGFFVNVRGNTLDTMARDTYIENFVAVKSASVGMYLRANKNTVLKQVTVLDGSGSGGVLADSPTSSVGDAAPTVFMTNTLSANNLGLPGVSISTAYTSWSVNFADSYSNAPNYSPSSDSRIVSSKTVSPNLGGCKVWIPFGSPMKATGQNGEDIGANILYRYQNGVLTSVPLWNLDGSFPHGAIISGVNDTAGASALDVHQRLNVNTNGCSFPAGYGSTTVTSAPAPLALRIVQ